MRANSIGSPIVAALAAILLQASPALAANPPLAARGPVSPVHPLPLWYQDSNGVRLEPCLDTTTTAPPNPCQLTAGAGLSGGTFNPALPVAFPGNFPSRIQYLWENAEVSILGNNRGLVYIAELVGAFAGGNPASPQVFTHLRFDTNEAFTPFVTFTITHPYGVFTLATDDRGDLCPANNKACDIFFPDPAPVGAFDGVLIANPSVNPNDATVGTFLSAFVPPPGFIGDGAARVQVTGSPTGNNLVRIQGPASGPGSLDLGSTCAGGTIPNCAEGTLFTLIGRKFDPAGGPTTRFAVTGPATGGAGVAQTFTVTATDVNGNTTTGYTGIVRFSSSDPQALLPGDATLTAGVGTFQATPRTVGSFVLTARDTVATGITGSATMTVTAGPVASLVAVSGGGQVGGTGAALAAPLVVRAADAFGNPKGGVSVTFASLSGGSVTPGTTLTDVVTGEASTVATLGPGAGAQSFTATAVGVATPVTFAATAGVPGQPVTLAISGLSPGVVAGADAPFTVSALDAFGAPATLATGAAGALSITSSDPAATLPAAAQLTLGTAALSATFRTAGSRTLTATLAADPAVTASATTLVSAGAAATLAAVSGGGQSGTVGTSLPAPLVVRVTDAFGNARSGVTVTFAAPAGGAVSPAAPVTAADGTASTAATLGTLAGAQAFTATAAGLGGSPLTFTATAAPGPAASLSLTGLAATVTAGATAGLTVTARDAFGNVATGFAGAVHLTSSDPAAVLPPDAGLPGGAAPFSVSLRTAGPATVTATAVGAPGVTGSASTTVVAAAASTLAAVSGDGQSGTAGAPLAAPFVVRAADQFGNPVAGVVVTFASGSGGTVTPATATTSAAGLASATGTLSGTVGAQGFTASVAGLGGSPVAFGATAAPGPAAVLAVTGLSAATTAGVAAPFTVTARDAFGNVASGFAGTVGFTASDPAATLPAASALTAGTAAFSATFRSAGDRTLTVAVTGSPGVAGTASTTVAAAGASTLAAVSGGGQAGEVGQPLAAPLVVRAADAFGNPVAGVTVAFAGPAGGAVAPASAATDAAGQASASATLGGAVGPQAFTATAAGLGGSPVIFNATAAAGPPAALAVTGLAASTTAGVPAAFTVTVRDAFGNVATGFTGTVDFASTDPAASLPATAPLAAGVGAFSATFRTAGARTLAASVTGAPTVTGSAGTAVAAGPAATLAAVSGGGQTGVVGAALAAPLVARVSDAFGNPVAGTTVAFSAPPTGGVTPASAVSAADGTASAVATLPTGAGATAFGASAAVPAGSPLSFPATAVPGAPATLALAGVPASTAAGTPFLATVTAADAFGNPATNFSGAISLTSSDPGAALPAAPALVLGTGTFSVILNGAGSQTLTAALPGVPGSAASAAVDVAAGPATSLARASGDGQAGTVGLALAAPFVVRATDAFGNPKAGVTVTFTAPAGGGVAPASAVTAADGTAGATGTLGQAAGPQAFQAASAGLSGSPITFTATAAPGPAASLALAGLPTSLAAGTTSSLVVTALDAFGNVATGFSGSVLFTSSDPAAGLPAGAALSAGTGTFQVTLRTGGSRTVTVQAAGAPGLTATATTLVGPAAPAALALTATPGTTAPAGTATAQPVTVLVTDSLGNPVPGFTVGFAAPAGASISPASATTDAQGNASATPTVGTTAGGYTFTVTAPGLQGSPATFTVTAVAGPGAFLALERPSGATALDCGCYDLTARLQDEFGNPVAQGLPGVTVTATGQARVTATDLVATGLPAATVTGTLKADGTALVRVCDQQPETASVAVAAAGKTGGGVDLTWLLGPVDPAASGLTSDTPLLAAFSGRAHVTVTPRSACGNPVGAGLQVLVGLAGPGSVTPTVDAGDGRYTATVDVTPCPVEQATQVTARVGAVDLPPLDLAIACVEPSAAQTVVTPSRGVVVVCDEAGLDALTVTVTPRDAAGADMGPGNQVAVAVAGFAGGAVQDAGDGTYLATFTAGGCQAGGRDVEVTVNGVALGPPRQALQVSCAPVDPAASGVSVPSAHGVADGATPVAIAVVAVNTCGQPARAQPVVLSTTLGTLASGGGTTDAAGTLATSLTSAQAGAATLTATAGGVALPAAVVTFDAPPSRGGGGCATGGEAGLLGLVLAGLALGGRRTRRRGR